MGKADVNKKSNILFIVLFVFLALYVLSMMFMFGFALMNSFKDMEGFAKAPMSFPSVWTIDNYRYAYSALTIIKTVGNRKLAFDAITQYWYSILYAVGCAFVSTLVPCIVAYLCAKYKYKFSGIIVAVVLISMSLPIVGSTPSVLQLVRKLGIYNTIYGMWIMSAHFVTGIHFLVQYNAFNSLSDAYVEAAEIDGASQMSVMLRIMLPLTKNIFATVFLLRLIGLWNDYQTPLLYIPDRPTIAYGLNYLVNIDTSTITDPVTGEQITREVPLKLAASFMVFTPIFIVFCIFQNRIMTNLSIGGIKG